MPISVLSTLSLGLAVDFAIHFVSRFQQRYRETRDLEAALVWTVARPGRGSCGTRCSSPRASP